MPGDVAPNRPFRSVMIKFCTTLCYDVVIDLVQQRCPPSQWPLLCRHSSLTNCIPQSQKIEGTEDCIHIAISLQSTGQVRNITILRKYVDKVSFISTQISIDLNQNNLFLVRITNGRFGRESCNECRSISNDTSSGDFTIYLGLVRTRR